MKNADIRLLILSSRLKQYEIAEKLGYSESYFSKLMRKELKPEIREKVLQVINELTGA